MDLQTLEIYKAELEMVRDRLRDANPQSESRASIETVAALENAIRGFDKLIRAKKRVQGVVSSSFSTPHTSRSKGAGTSSFSVPPTPIQTE